MTPYPDPLDDEEGTNPEVVLLWARRTVLKTEIKLFEEDIEAHEKKVEKGEEVTQDDTEKYEHAKNALTAAKEEKAIV